MLINLQFEERVKLSIDPTMGGGELTRERVQIEKVSVVFASCDFLL